MQTSHVSWPELAMRTGSWVDVRPGNVRNVLSPEAINNLVRAPVGQDPNQVTTNLPGVSPPAGMQGYFGDAELGVAVNLTPKTVGLTAAALAVGAGVGALVGGKKRRARGAATGVASIAAAAAAFFGIAYATHI